jgi:hypothetical protein
MNPSEEENARMDAAYDQPPQQARSAMSGIQQPREATSWEVIECGVCGAPVLFLADDTGAWFTQIHLDGDSLEDLVAELIDLSGDADEPQSPEASIPSKSKSRGVYASRHPPSVETCRTYVHETSPVDSRRSDRNLRRARSYAGVLALLASILVFGVEFSSRAVWRGTCQGGALLDRPCRNVHVSGAGPERFRRDQARLDQFQRPGAGGAEKRDPM